MSLVKSSVSILKRFAEMNWKIIFIFSLITIVSSLPLNDDNDDEKPRSGLSINDFFAQLNDNLKREITKDIGNETKVEVGDKFKDDGGSVVISVQTFSFDSDKFPVTFKPSTSNDSLADDKEITAIKGDFEESAIYKIENEDSDEVTETTTLSTKKSSTTETTTTTKALKEQKIQKAISQVPILTGA